MKEMSRCFMDEWRFADRTKGRMGFITLVKTCVGGAKTADMFRSPKVKEIWGIVEATFNGVPVDSIKTRGCDGLFVVD